MSKSERQNELVLLARRCHTLARGSGDVQGVAVRDGRIVAVGTRARVRFAVGRRARVVDFGDAVLTPGLVDCHTHFFYWALQRKLVIDVGAAVSLEAALATLRARAVRKRVGEWVVGTGFDKNAWGREFPEAADLDRAIPDRPALVYSRDGHTVWLNSVALQRVGISESTPDPAGGGFLRDAQGRPTGIVRETAIDLLPNPVREFAQSAKPTAVRTIDRALEEAYAIAWSFGIVGVHCMDDDAALAHFQRHRQAKRLGIRVVHAVQRVNLPHVAALGLRSGLGDETLRLGGIKMFADGALGSQSAYMFEAYPQRPGYFGVAALAGLDLKDAVVEAARRGWPAWIHAIGDRAAHEAIEAIAAARRVESTRLVHRIEHAQCVRPADVRRMAWLGIVASVQPCHILGDIKTADRHWPRARRNAYPLRRMLQAGVTLAAGSDVPIESLDPRRSFFAATCRTDACGEPRGGWFAEQKLTAREVLRAFTVNAAAAGGCAGMAGTLTPGAPADVTVWREDPLAVGPEKLLEVGIAGCVVAGEVHVADGG